MDLKLSEMAAYIEYGGRHPSLPTQCQDSQSINYFHDMCFAGSLERQQAFWLRMHEARVSRRSNTWPWPDLSNRNPRES